LSLSPAWSQSGGWRARAEYPYWHAREAVSRRPGFHLTKIEHVPEPEMAAGSAPAIMADKSSTEP
jgi:hypothetical protein